MANGFLYILHIHPKICIENIYVVYPVLLAYLHVNFKVFLELTRLPTTPVANLTKKKALLRRKIIFSK